MKCIPKAALAGAHAPSPFAGKTAKRLIFPVAALGKSAWAPMVPYAKARLGLDDAQPGGARLAFVAVAGLLVRVGLSARTVQR